MLHEKERKNMSDEIYKVYAVKYGELDRPASENFIGGDPHARQCRLTFTSG
jgi:hypothetical protein